MQPEVAVFLVPMTLFVSLAAVFILRGPLGKALADRLAGRVHGERVVHDDALGAAVDHLQQRMTEVEERLDFTERLLTSERERKALPPE
jgi:hypothetical protein